MMLGITGPRRTASQFLLPIVPILLASVAGPMHAPAHTAFAAAGETANNTCFIHLPVPEQDQIEFSLQSSARGPGLLITWPDLEPAVTTCTALLDTVALGFTVAVSGHYSAIFDRLFDFAFTDSGVVGDQAKNEFYCQWRNLNVGFSGDIRGRINLSNTGGLWIQGAGTHHDVSWSQLNDGLPVHSRLTNLVDVAASQDGQTKLIGVTTGVEFNTNPLGLFRSVAGGPWQQVASDLFGTRRIITHLAVSPLNAEHFAVGTETSGMFVTTDGGASFTQWTSNLDPDFSSTSNQYPVTALVWTADRLYVAVQFFGLFFAGAEDSYGSFTRLANFAIAGQVPRVRCLAIDPSDSDRLVAGLTLTGDLATSHNGVYETRDAGQTWQSLHTQFVGLPHGGVTNPSARKTALSIYIDHADGQRMVMGTDNRGFWHTTDGGNVWHEAASPFVQGEGVDPNNQPSILALASHGQTLLAQVFNRGLHVWSDGAGVWTALEDQPFNRRGRRILSTDAGLLLATTGGGIFTPGSTVSLTNTMTTTPRIDLGLSLIFGPGAVTLPEDPSTPGAFLPRSFRLLAQDHQGWIVWRSDGDSPDDMIKMIGRYDKLNPETCIEGFCGDDSYVIDPRCFSERLAACFDFSRPGYVSFYDDNIFNGFTYHYAVTPFDYGNISMLQSPTDLSSPMVFPPRFPGDGYVNARYEGDPLPDGMGNRRMFQVNAEAAPALDGKDVYVYPNPLRLGRGIPGGEGEEVVWTNLPPDSKIQVFTLAGDHITDLPQPDRPQQDGNIYWTTRNIDGQVLSAGIYMWKLIMPQRGDYWGKLVIIR